MAKRKRLESRKNKRLPAGYVFLQMQKQIFGDMLDIDAILPDIEALNTALNTDDEADEWPEYPLMPADPVERKKVVTQYVKRLYLLSNRYIIKYRDIIITVKQKQARLTTSSSSMMAAQAAVAADELEDLQLVETEPGKI